MWRQTLKKSVGNLIMQSRMPPPYASISTPVPFIDALTFTYRPFLSLIVPPSALPARCCSPFPAPAHYSSSSSSSPPHQSSNTPGLAISEAAITRLKQLQQTSPGGTPIFLRLTVEGGGCSGFQYEFSVEESGPTKGDQVFQSDGVSVICDDVSMEFLQGATVDYESDLMRSAFVVRLFVALHSLVYIVS